MSILAAAAIEVGTLAAKIICKMWLKDVPGGDDMSSDFIDLLKDKTSDILVQRQGRRVFENIGDRISNEILSVLREGSRIEEGERSAIAYAVAETLKKSRLTNEIPLKQNLQPIELKKYIMDANPSVKRDFSL